MQEAKKLRSLCGTHENSKIEVLSVVESAKIVTNVKAFQDCALHQLNELMKGTDLKHLDICFNFGTFNNIQYFFLEGTNGWQGRIDPIFVNLI